MDEPIQQALVDNKSKASSRPSPEHHKATKALLAQANGFESDRIALAKQSATQAWRVAAGLGVITVLAVGAVIMLTPLKTVTPYVLKINSDTGTTTVLSPLTDAQSTTYGEALDKYWLSQYVINRNGYNWETVQNSYNIVKLMSANDVFSTYSRYIRGDQSPVDVFADKKVIKVSINSVTFLPATSTDSTLAQVQFTRNVLTATGEPVVGYQPTNWNATLTFDYRATVRKETERMINPLAFHITSYREDEGLNP
ncbi:virB8 family protein [Photobacterium indicum]|uniref:virB8 family protein n=1 Tax=Photobacterium indicum TaxID=81447 RepID=UPI003D143A3D